MILKKFRAGKIESKERKGKMMQLYYNLKNFKTEKCFT